LTAGAEIGSIALPTNNAESNLPPMNTILLRFLLACLCAGYMTAARSEETSATDYYLASKRQDPMHFSQADFFTDSVVNIAPLPPSLRRRGWKRLHYQLALTRRQQYSAFGGVRLAPIFRSRPLSSIGTHTTIGSI